MPVKDEFHDLVRKLLEANGWVITHDPLVLRFGKRSTYVDLAAIAAEQNGRKIAVEVKGTSLYQLSELERALGQYLLYRVLLQNIDPERKLYVAAPLDTVEQLWLIEEFRQVVAAVDLNVMTYDVETEVIVEWNGI